MQTTTRQTRTLIAGVDEAGRGPLAGPVVAAAVIFFADQDIADYTDSKVLSPARRDTLAQRIRDESLCWSIGWADRAEIDSINILNATMLAMRRAVLGLSNVPHEILVDGNRVPDIAINERRIEAQPIVKGDASVASIGAASILAKTARDTFMVRMDTTYPGYDFARHKGYGTELHRQQLQAMGPCDLHRRSFGPVRALL